MVLSLYNLVLTSFSMVQGQGLALRGPPGSLAKAGGIFQDQWRIVRIVLVASLLAIVTAGASISWMKLDGMIACMEMTGAECACKVDSPIECFARRFWRPVVVSVIVTTLVIAMFRKVRQMQLQLRILSEDLVRPHPTPFTPPTPPHPPHP